MHDTILVLGANGQIGTELVMELRRCYGANNVVATDIKPLNHTSEGPFELLDAMNKDGLAELIKKYKVTQIYHLVALLSATAEKNPKFGWDLNMNSLFGVMDCCVELGVKKLFWPSSIAVFGTSTPKANVPQYTAIEPATVYGISKQAGEQWCSYYHSKKGLDVRSIRYPGLIGYKSAPGGGTTDYAVEIFYEALKHQKYNCFLAADTRLPMMYMPDAINATLQLMNAPAEKLSVRTSYNIEGIDFTPHEIASAIKKNIPGFEISYAPDFRQQIAASWPGSIDGRVATADWGWKPQYNLETMVADMLANVKVESTLV